MTATIPEQGEAPTEAVEVPLSNRKGARRALWALQVVTCIILLPWSLPLIWKRIKESRQIEKEELI